jgi:hypothetical protein
MSREEAIQKGLILMKSGQPSRKAAEAVGVPFRTLLYRAKNGIIIVIKHL